jgi:eukaryotic-like serine/threonine-protein kinase
MARLDPTVRDPDRPALLAPTLSPATGSPRPAPDGSPPAAPALPEGYELDCWLDVEGAGQVAGVARAHRLLRRTPRIVKLYRPSAEARAGVHEAWRAMQGRHPSHPSVVVRLHEAGSVAGHEYEVMDEAGDRVGGEAAPRSARRLTLRDVIAEHPQGIRADLLDDVVKQLASALTALGQAGLVHRDVRPENVLVTSRGPGSGWKLTLVDLGMAVRLIDPVVYGVTRRFTPYTAPELLSGSVSAPTDWWSLGVLAAELAAGGHPLVGLDPETIERQLATGHVVPPRGLPERVAALHAGLTAREPADRWGATQVTAWLGGDDPDLPPQRDVPQARGFAFAGETFRYLPPLLHALQRHWDDAVAVLLGPQADRWAEFGSWLAQFDRAGFDARRVVEHVDRLSAPPEPWSPDARLLVLLRRAGPGLAPEYRGVPVDREAIPRLARVADEADGERPDPRFREVIDDLWHRPLLTELDGAAGARGLAAVDERWRRLDQRWLAVRELLRDSAAPLAEYLVGLDLGLVHVYLLRVAADPTFPAQLRTDLEQLRRVVDKLDTSSRALEELAATVLPTLPASRGWRRRPAEPPPDDAELVGLLMLHLVHEGVVRDAEDQRDRRAREVASRAQRAAGWDLRERWRMLDRPVAVGWAAAAMAVVFLVFALLLVVADVMPPQRWLPPADDGAIARAWAFVALGLAGQTAAELWLAASIGTPYHHDHSLVSILLRGAGRVSWAGNRFLTSAVVLSAVLVVGAAVLAGLLTAPYALMLPLLAVHVVSARLRHRQWCEAHQVRRKAALGADAPLTPAEGQLT